MNQKGTVPAPKGTWVSGVAIIGVIAAQVAALGGYWLMERPEGEKQRTNASPKEVPVGKPIAPANIKAKLKIEIKPGTPTPSPGYPGIVTSVYVGAGGVASSGAKLFALDGVDRYGYHAERPFYRVLREGDSGPDVVQLRTLLNDVGVGPVSVRRDTYDYMVAAAVTKLTKKLGLAVPAVTTAVLGPTPTAIANNGSPVTTTSAAATTTSATTASSAPEPGTVKSVGPVFDPQWTVWLPAPSVQVAASNVKKGLALPLSGTPMYTSAKTLGAVTLSTDTPLPRLSVPVRRSFEADGVSIPLHDDRVTVGVGNAEQLIRLALGADPDPTKPVTVDGVVKSTVSATSVSVPVSAVYESTQGNTCAAVKDGRSYTGRRVVVVASSAASAQATVDGLRAGSVVVANPSETGDSPDC